MQRLRARFSRGDGLKFISHLDILRLWERAMHRAELPLAYSEGFSPHPRLSAAAPLAVGVTSEGELMDVLLTRGVSVQFFTTALNQQFPPDLRVLQVFQMTRETPSLQSQVRFAEYRMEVKTGGAEEAEKAMTALLAREHLPWQHQRDTGPRSYDLRALVDDLWLIEHQAPYSILGMRLRCDSGGSGRPEQVSLALGWEHAPRSIHRTRLILGLEERFAKGHTGKTR